MQAIDLRNQLMQFINTADESSLRSFFEFIKNQKNKVNNDEVVAYSSDGEPLTKEMYIQKVKEASASVDAGNFLTAEELEKEAESWK